MPQDNTSSPLPEESLVAAPLRDPATRGTSQRRSIVAWCLAVLVGAAAALFVVTTVPRGGTDQTAPIRHSAVDGKRLATLRLQSLDGDSTLVLEDLRGKVSLINFWGPWCSACYFELPHLKALQKKFGENMEFTLISVSCGPDAGSEDLAQLRIDTAQYLQQQSLPFPAYMDVSGQTRQTIVEAAELQNTGIAYPLNLVLDRDGIIRGLWMGYEPGVEIEISDAISQLLKNSGT